MGSLVFDVKTTTLPQVTSLISIGDICVTCHKTPPNHGTAEFDKLLLETKPVAHGYNVVLTSKLCPQTSLMPYSTVNRSNGPWKKETNKLDRNPVASLILEQEIYNTPS